MKQIRWRLERELSQNEGEKAGRRNFRKESIRNTAIDKDYEVTFMTPVPTKSKAAFLPDIYSSGSVVNSQPNRALKSDR